MHRVLITGATGFVGRALVNRAALDGWRVRAVVRQPGSIWPADVEPALVGDLAPTTDWRTALGGVQTVVHLAARVHVMRDSAADALAEFRLANAVGTLNLARQAVDAGVRRFVFISSIKVNGECTDLNRPYTADDVPAPVDPYAISKHEAERGLTQLAEETALELVIIRPVLVYGPGVKANFFSMMRWLHRRIPLPLGAVHNKRSLVALDNLVDLIITCMQHAAAVNQTFLVSDGEDMSTAELIRRLAQAMGRRARLIPLPADLLMVAATVLGQRAAAQRLLRSLQVDISKTRELLGWMPPVSVDEGLRRTVEHYLQQQQYAATL